MEPPQSPASGRKPMTADAPGRVAGTGAPLCTVSEGGLVEPSPVTSLITPSSVSCCIRARYTTLP